MGTLDAALQWARRGFSVFPLKENSKEPAFEDWINLATANPDMLRQLWVDPVLQTERNYNIGCLCSDYVVVDVDVKAGKDGLNQYLQLGGTWDTLTVRTPTGGYHCYFHGPNSSNAGVADGVDIRSHHGYVVAPGSTIDGLAYEVCVEQDLKWVPANIEGLLQAPYVREDATFLHDIDSPASVQMAKDFLLSTPAAVEGMRGDETTFIAAARLVREMALSPSTAFYLMRDYYNPRCSPQWDLADLWKKVENAAAYGSADLGRLAPETLFADIHIEIPPNVFEQAGVEWGNAVTSSDIRPRPWLVERMLMSGAITLLLAAGSAGKSSLSLAIAAHLALGLPFAGYTPRRACKTIIYNGEDDVDEQSRRLIALCATYALNYAEVSQRVMLLSSRELKLMLVRKDQGRAVRDETLVNQLVALAADPDVGLLVVDPLVRIHQCNENDSVEMDYVMETLTDIAHKSGTAILALHHMPKLSGVQGDKAGNPDLGRGAGSIVNAARIAFTFMPASIQDVEDYGINEQDRNMYIRLDDAKMNFTLASNRASWFKKYSVRIASHDIVGVLKPEEMEKNKQHIRTRVAKLLLDTMTNNNSATMPILQALGVVQAGIEFYANLRPMEIRRRLEGFFASPVSIEGRSLKINRGEDEKPLLVLT